MFRRIQKPKGKSAAYYRGWLMATGEMWRERKPKRLPVLGRASSDAVRRVSRSRFVAASPSTRGRKLGTTTGSIT